LPKRNSVHIDNQGDTFLLELRVEPSGPRDQALWVLLFLVPSLACLGIVARMLSQPERIYASWFVALGLLALFAWYFLRLLLWGRGGKEVLRIHPRHMLHYSDYRLFLLGKKTYPYEAFEISFYKIDGEGGPVRESDLLDDLPDEGGRGLLFVELDGARTLETGVDIPYSEFRRLAEGLESYSAKAAKSSNT
jgi:hypothetical protein